MQPATIKAPFNADARPPSNANSMRMSPVIAIIFRGDSRTDAHRLSSAPRDTSSDKGRQRHEYDAWSLHRPIAYIDEPPDQEGNRQQTEHDRSEQCAPRHTFEPTHDASALIDEGERSVESHSLSLSSITLDAELRHMPTHRDHPWLRDQRAVTTSADPEDPTHSAAVHAAKQQKAIDEARRATSQPPPGQKPL